MPTYIILGHFTDQGMRNVKDTPKRANALKEAAKKYGATVKNVYWTLGAYDVLAVIDAPDSESMAKLLFNLGSLGNVRTQSLRALEAGEVERILGSL
jgi:uncharacterized protein with GYD domain